MPTDFKYAPGDSATKGVGTKYGGAPITVGRRILVGVDLKFRRFLGDSAAFRAAVRGGA